MAAEWSEVTGSEVVQYFRLETYLIGTGTEGENYENITITAWATRRSSVSFTASLDCCSRIEYANREIIYCTPEYHF